MTTGFRLIERNVRYSDTPNKRKFGEFKFQTGHADRTRQPSFLEEEKIPALNIQNNKNRGDDESHYQLQLVHSQEAGVEDLKEALSSRHAIADDSLDDDGLDDDGDDDHDDDQVGMLKPSTMRARYVLQWFQNHPKSYGRRVKASLL